MMKVHSWTGLIFGFILVVIGILGLIFFNSLAGFIPVLIGAGLIYLNWRGGRAGLVVFGHICIVLGCFLVTWGIYLLPYSQPILLHIVARPLFWGLISIFGGICADYHGFCNCIRQQNKTID
ncbi:MAG: hypothetical protein WBB37_08045 [bacterium]